MNSFCLLTPKKTKRLLTQTPHTARRQRKLMVCIVFYLFYGVHLLFLDLFYLLKLIDLMVETCTSLESASIQVCSSNEGDKPAEVDNLEPYVQPQKDG